MRYFFHGKNTQTTKNRRVLLDMKSQITLYSVATKNKRKKDFPLSNKTRVPNSTTTTNLFLEALHREGKETRKQKGPQ